MPIPWQFIPVGPDCCSCGCKVLLWNTNCNYWGQGLEAAQYVYEQNGICAHLSDEWTENLSDYFLILWLMAESDPPWWGEITGATWSGRLHLTAEYQGWNDTINYVNSKTALHGMTVANDVTDPTSTCPDPDDGTAESHQLMAGVSQLWHVNSARVSGGTTLSKSGSKGDGSAWIQQKKVGNIDWVVAGDSNHIADYIFAGSGEPLVYCNDIAADNSQFLLNLANKALP